MRSIKFGWQDAINDYALTGLEIYPPFKDRALPYAIDYAPSARTNTKIKSRVKSKILVYIHVEIGLKGRLSIALGNALCHNAYVYLKPCKGVIYLLYYLPESNRLYQLEWTNPAA